MSVEQTRNQYSYVYHDNLISRNRKSYIALGKERVMRSAFLLWTIITLSIQSNNNQIGNYVSCTFLMYKKVEDKEFK